MKFPLPQLLALSSALLFFNPSHSTHAARIAVLSDIHIYRSGNIPTPLPAAIEETLRLKPDAVVLLGDSTSGNPDDGSSPDTVRMWWRSLQTALGPIQKAGIPILPVPGNHDFYTEAQRQGYREAWAGPPRGIKVTGNYPELYQAELPGTELHLLPIVDQLLPTEVRNILDKASQTPKGDQVRLVFGHVPLASRMGRSSPSFLASLGSALLRLQSDIYISGHEHLTWEEELPVGSALVRQLWVGTATATYTFPITQKMRELHCEPASSRPETLCRMPGSGRYFRIDSSSRSQLQKQVVALLKTGSDRTDPHSPVEVEIRARGTDSGPWSDFYESAKTKTGL